MSKHTALDQIVGVIHNIQADPHADAGRGAVNPRPGV
jgi:hypothetical protein